MHEVCVCRAVASNCCFCTISDVDPLGILPIMWSQHLRLNLTSMSFSSKHAASQAKCMFAGGWMS